MTIFQSVHRPYWGISLLALIANRNGIHRSGRRKLLAIRQAVFAPRRYSMNLKDTEINWDCIERNWTQFKSNVKAQCCNLTDDQLDVIVGKRDKRASDYWRTREYSTLEKKS